MGSAIPASAEQPQSAQSIELFLQHCLLQESVSAKLRRLEATGWSEPLSGIEDVRNQHVLVHDARPQVITITAPDRDPEIVRDCIVDGKDVDARELVDAAIGRWGIPQQGAPGLAHWTVDETFGPTIILADSRILNRDPQVPLIALAIRHGPPVSGTE